MSDKRSDNQVFSNLSLVKTKFSKAEILVEFRASHGSSQISEIASTSGILDVIKQMSSSF